MNEVSDWFNNYRCPSKPQNLVKDLNALCSLEKHGVVTAEQVTNFVFDYKPCDHAAVVTDLECLILRLEKMLGNKNVVKAF